MRKGMRVLVAALLICITTATAAVAAEIGLQQVFDTMTVGGHSSVTAATDFVADGSDSYWTITGNDVAISSIVVELAGFASQNEFGVYQGDTFVRLFSGSASAGSRASLLILPDGSVKVNNRDTGVDFTGDVFGFYLHTPQNVYLLSDTSSNGDGIDHMLAYQGKNDRVILPRYLLPVVWSDTKFVLAWEDLYGGGDGDYNDFVVMVSSVVPAAVPEPGTLVLLGVGLVGLGGMVFYRRRRN